MERFLRYYSDETTLFGGRYMPVTDSISFLNASLDSVVEPFETWRFPAETHNMSIIKAQVSFEDGLKSLEPLGAHPQFLLVATAHEQWTAVLSNFWLGGAQDQLAHRIGYMLGIDSLDILLSWPLPKKRKKPLGGFGVSVQENLPRGSFPIAHRYVATLENSDPRATEFDVYRHYRSIETVADLRETKGDDEPLDRFNPDDLLSYCRGRGIDVFNEDFYQGGRYRVAVEHLQETTKRETGKYSTYEAVQEFLGVRSLVNVGSMVGR